MLLSLLCCEAAETLTKARVSTPIPRLYLYLRAERDCDGDTYPLGGIKMHKRPTEDPTFTKQAETFCHDLRFPILVFWWQMFLMNQGLCFSTSHHFLIVLGDLLSGRHVLSQTCHYPSLTPVPTFPCSSLF